MASGTCLGQGAVRIGHGLLLAVLAAALVYVFISSIVMKTLLAVGLVIVVELYVMVEAVVPGETEVSF